MSSTRKAFCCLKGLMSAASSRLTSDVPLMPPESAKASSSPSPPHPPAPLPRARIPREGREYAPAGSDGQNGVRRSLPPLSSPTTIDICPLGPPKREDPAAFRKPGLLVCRKEGLAAPGASEVPGGCGEKSPIFSTMALFHGEPGRSISGAAVRNRPGQKIDMLEVHL